jgi:hypothetical protein
MESQAATLQQKQWLAAMKSQQHPEKGHSQRETWLSAPPTWLHALHFAVQPVPTAAQSLTPIFVIKNKVESSSPRGCTLPPGVSNICTKIAGCKADPGCTAAAEPARLQAHPPMQSNRQYYAC